MIYTRRLNRVTYSDPCLEGMTMETLQQVLSLFAEDGVEAGPGGSVEISKRDMRRCVDALRKGNAAVMLDGISGAAGLQAGPETLADSLEMLLEQADPMGEMMTVESF